MNETILGDESGFEHKQKIVFKEPRVVDFRASVHDIANYLMDLMSDKSLRQRLGKAARKHVVENFDYRVIAKRFVQIINNKLGIS
jgi:glycosyltransferase involved in cell wall biosynthesis